MPLQNRVTPEGELIRVDARGTFSIEGVLRYQACDDRLCYVPQELPLKWTFQLETLDRQRVPAGLQRKAPQAQ